MRRTKLAVVLILALAAGHATVSTRHPAPSHHLELGSPERENPEDWGQTVDMRWLRSAGTRPDRSAL
jgi:hypothetical protein